MAEDLGERTEQPTEHRLETARRKGQVARSADLSAAVVIAAVILASLLFAPMSLEGIARLLRFALSGDTLGAGVHTGALTQEIATMSAEAARVMVPVMMFMLVIGTAGAVAQVGWRITPTALEPKWNKLNVITGFGNLFGRRALVKGGLDLLKFSVIAVLIGYVVTGQHREILALANLDLLQGFERAAALVRDLAIWIVAVLIVLGVVDYWYQRWQHRSDLRMTTHEVKEERKDNEGDAEMKGRRMRIARQVAMQRLGAAVPTADVVVTNPTHYAVALKYDGESAKGALRVVAKGADFLALKMRYLAASAGVPIVERPPLARALYNEVAVGKEIHPAHYEAVAEVLAYVYRLERRAG